MNNKGFIYELSQRSGLNAKETNRRITSFLNIMTQELQEGNWVMVYGFGSFEVKKKLERMSINPITHQRMLIPPKLVLSFKPSNNLKDKLK